MVIGANSIPTGIPNLGCSEEGNLIQCKHSSVIQYSCENSMAVRDSPLWLDSCGLLCVMVGVLTASREVQFSVFDVKGKCTL